ncbi:glycosyltransferase family 4 protein [Streptomyces sp. NPDC102365]|uniref:glycosyltransferase family 4 protein n=1 Tax=Streptomyces sp. NPDC102365 TaxID=3366162 RepID=UPI003817A951
MPGTGLAWRGHQVGASTVMSAAWQDADTIVGSRVCLPGPSRLWRHLHDEGRRLVLDLDDDYFHIDPSNEAAHRDWTTHLLPGLIDNLTYTDTVTVCSETLAQVVRDYHDDVRVIENGLPAQHLGLPRDYTPDMLTVGCAVTTSTLHELPLAARALNRIADYKPGKVEVLLIGPTGPQARKAGVRHLRIGTTGWVDGFSAYAGWAYQFDVWVAPYRDTVFNRAKFPTKALEAGFFGIPLIVSDVGAYREWITHGENGFLVPAGQEHLFGKYLKQLVDDSALRQSMGIAARARASRNILQALSLRWEDVVGDQSLSHSTGALP